MKQRPKAAWSATERRDLGPRRVALLMAAALLVLAVPSSYAAGKESAGKLNVVKAQAFDLTQVRLLDGPFKDCMERDRKYLLYLEPDRLLHMFRVTAGLPSSAKPYGGWENPGCEVRGHTMGHYLSGCALMYASTGDKAVKARADGIVAELAKCQAAMPSRGYNPGYLSAFPESFFDRVDNSQPVWAPWYTMHKIAAGLLDMYTCCGNSEAYEVLSKLAAWAKLRSDRLGDEKMQRSLNAEFGGVGETFANLYAVSHNPDHLLMARRFEKNWFLDPLSKGVDNLRGLHSNTHIPQVVAAAREYEVTGEARYRDISTFFFKQTADARSFATGGTSNYEHWRTEPYKMASEISVESQETCCTYNMLKLTRHLFGWSPEPHYADYYERALFNGILGTQHPETGATMYYVPMKPGHWKIFHTLDNSFWCCTGTGLESHAKFGDSIYFRDARGLYVNLFIASELNWKEQGLRLRQDTRFPEKDGTALTFSLKRPVKLALLVRVPYWATQGVKIKINGRQEKVEAAPSSYVTLNRTWKNGDKVEVSLPMSLHLAPTPDDPNLAAVMYGPLVLIGRMGTKDFTKDLQFAADQRQYHNGPSIDAPCLVTDGKPVEEWVKPVPGQALTFRTVGAGRPNDVTLVPFYKLFDERYNLYWVIRTEAGYQAVLDEQKDREEREAAEQKDFEARVVDFVKIGDADSERAHNLQSESSNAGSFRGRAWRDAQRGWFSWDLDALPDVSQVVKCTYWGRDVNRTFDIMVDGVKIAEQTLSGEKGDNFFSLEYKIPPELLVAKTKVTVRFRAHEGSTAGGVFGAAVLKEKA